MDNDRLLILQYLLHKGDYYRYEAKKAIDKLRGSKYLTTADLEEIYKAVMRDEVFDEFQRDICKLFEI